MPRLTTLDGPANDRLLCWAVDEINFASVMTPTSTAVSTTTSLPGSKPRSLPGRVQTLLLDPPDFAGLWVHKIKELTEYARCHVPGLSCQGETGISFAHP